MFSSRREPCSSHKKYYEGEPRDQSSVFILSGSDFPDGGWGYSSILILSVDGAEANPENMIPNTVELLPGKHKIKVGYYNVRYYAYAYFNVEALSGKHYKINFDKKGLDHYQSMRLDSIWLEDAVSGEKISTLRNWTEVRERS